MNTFVPHLDTSGFTVIHSVWKLNNNKNAELVNKFNINTILVDKNKLS